LSVPAPALAVFEAALLDLGAAVVAGGVDETGYLPLQAYLSEEPDRGRLTTSLSLAAAAAGVAPPEPRLETLFARDWVAESQRSLPPVRVGRFFVHGAHVKGPPPSGSIPIRVEASRAFGTGRHESTQGCLLLLQDLAKRRRPRRCLDLGCGSAILAIAMARLWPTRVLAVDNDRDSLRLARVYVRDNGATARVRVNASDGYGGRAVRLGRPYDLIVANILAEPLCAMAHDLRRHLAPGGVALLSGLLIGQEQGVLARHRAEGLTLRRRLHLGAWSTLVLGG